LAPVNKRISVFGAFSRPWAKSILFLILPPGVPLPELDHRLGIALGELEHQEALHSRAAQNQIEVMSRSWSEHPGFVVA
jgi:hypothetical protein